MDFTQYHFKGFTWADQVRVADWLSQHAGPVVASNQATPRILELYKALGFKILILMAPRRISCTGDRKPVQEMLAVRNIPTRVIRKLNV